MYISKCLGQWCVLGRYPVRDGSHGAECTPGAWGIDECQRHTHDGGYHNDGPEHLTDASPHGQSALAPGHKAQLYAKHGEDKEHHKQSEPEGAHKLRYLAVGRILRQQSAVQIAARTNIAAPPSSFPDTE